MVPSLLAALEYCLDVMRQLETLYVYHLRNVNTTNATDQALHSRANVSLKLVKPLPGLNLKY